MGRIRVPTLLVTKISRTFQDPRSIFPGPCRTPVMFQYKDKQQLLRNPGRSPAASYCFVYTDNIWANFRKFWHLHLHHCVLFTHHSLENSRTFQDLSLKFPWLSRTKPIFQDFPWPGNFTKRNPGLSRRRENPAVFPSCQQNVGVKAPRKLWSLDHNHCKDHLLASSTVHPSPDSTWKG